jgi:hypothetical protein
VADERWEERGFRIAFIQLSAGWRYWAFGPDGWDCLWGLDPNGYTSQPAAIEACRTAMAKLPPEEAEPFHTTIRG